MASPTKIALTNTFNISDDNTIYMLFNQSLCPKFIMLCASQLSKANITPSNKTNKVLTKKKINKNKDIYALRSNSNKYQISDITWLSKTANKSINIYRILEAM